ncbi:MAG: hypothetical protein RR313_01335 [Anaerovoracaceae bacterium]
MFEKIMIKQNIKKHRKHIQELESRRARSQAGLISAILNREDVDSKDMEYFKTYTEQIEEIRVCINSLQDKLNKM